MMTRLTLMLCVLLIVVAGAGCESKEEHRTQVKTQAQPRREPRMPC